MARTPKKPRKDWVDKLAYLALRLLSMTLHCFPVNANLQSAKMLGNLIYRFDRKHRERALANLRRSFPELSDAHHQYIARKSLQEIPMLFVEVLFTTRLVRLDTWSKYVDLHDIRETLSLLLAREQGLIVITAHYGNFEILGYVLALIGFPTSSIARPLDNPYISQWLFSVREKMGQKIIVKKGATDEVVDCLTNKGTVAFVADQNAGAKGVFVDFFGRKASTYKSIGLVAIQFNVPIAIGYSRRVNDQFKFHVAVQDVIYPDDWANQSNPLKYITQRYSSAIESFIREDPTQYWWVHRRWKSRPKGEVPEAYD